MNKSDDHIPPATAATRTRGEQVFRKPGKSLFSVLVTQATVGGGVLSLGSSHVRCTFTNLSSELIDRMGEVFLSASLAAPDKKLYGDRVELTFAIAKSSNFDETTLLILSVIEETVGDLAVTSTIPVFQTTATAAVTTHGRREVLSRAWVKASPYS